MSDKLTDRLRGKYYESRDFSGLIPPICIEAANTIENLGKLLTLYQVAMN